MRRFKATKYLAAAIVVSRDGLYLLQGEDGTFGPVYQAGKTKAEARAYLEARLEELGAKAAIKSALPPIYMRHGHEFIELDAYRFDFFGTPKEEKRELNAIYVDEKKEYHFKMDAFMAPLIKRVMIYLPYYQKRWRTVPLFAEEQARLEWILAAVKYFGKRIATEERYEFEGLCASAASMKRIEAAFVDLCKRNHLNPHEYVAYLNYQEELRRKLQG